MVRNSMKPQHLASWNGHGYGQGLDFGFSFVIRLFFCYPSYFPSFVYYCSQLAKPISFFSFCHSSY